MLMSHHVCITQQNMILTMIIMLIFMSLLKQCRMIELSFFQVVMICVELLVCSISFIQTVENIEVRKHVFFLNIVHVNSS